MQENGGFIKLYRSLLDWEWYDDPNTLRVFLHIMLKASWKETKCRGETVRPGEYVTTITEIAEELCISKRNVRTALEHLKVTHELTIKTSPKTSTISINNWGKFQQTDTLSDTQPTHSRHAPFFIEEYKEGKKNKKRESGGFAPPTLDEVALYIAEKGYRFTAERFVSYYSAVGWKRHGTAITNWKSLADLWEQREREKHNPAEQEKPKETICGYDSDELESFGLLS